jgi:hypothetical protein
MKLSDLKRPPLINNGSHPSQFSEWGGQDDAETSLDRFLNSDWAFGMTLKGARRRRLLFIFAASFLWAFFAYLNKSAPWDVATGIRFLIYPFRALFISPIFPLILALAVFLRRILMLVGRTFSVVGKKFVRITSLCLAVLLGGIWALLASRLYPPTWGAEFPKMFVAYPFEALFAAPVFRHVLIAALAFWIAFRVAAIYLDDIFELNDISIAERFILQAVFASNYNTLHIKNGEVAPKDKNSAIFKIGGPGYVRVYLENAALFEKNGGSSRVIGPTGDEKSGVAVLEGFERLRKVIKLVDQFDEIKVEGRTQDGIRVKAEGVNIVYSVYRNGQLPTLSRPYPFDPVSIQRLVYNQQGKSPLDLAMSGMIRSELSKFISRHTLNEFLATIDESEYNQHPMDITLERGSPSSSSDRQNLPTLLSFVSRPSILTELFASEFHRRAAERGVELKWAGVGTWVTPDEIVPSRHLEAWRLSRENLIRGSEKELNRLRFESQIAEFVRLVIDVPLLSWPRTRAQPPIDALRSLVIAYRVKLNEAFDILQENDLPPRERERLRRVLIYLSYFSGRWL